MERTDFNNSSKPMYDLYLSYSSKDQSFAKLLCEALEYNGLRVFYALRDVLYGGEYSESIVSAIKVSKYFVPIISDNSVTSKWCRRELELALHEAQDRSKPIIPVCLSSNTMNIATIKELPIYLQIKNASTIFCNERTEEAAQELANILAVRIKGEKEETELHERLSEYLKSGADGLATEVLCKLAENSFREIEEIYKSTPNCSKIPSFRNKIAKLISQLDKIDDLYDYVYGEEGRKIAHKKKPVIDGIRGLLKYDLFSGDDLFLISCAIRLIYFEREILYASIDATTGGDLSDGIIDVPPVYIEKFIDAQKIHTEKYDRELVIQNSKDYSEDEWLFIMETPKFIYKKYKYNDKAKKPEPPKEKKDELLLSVASFMREGNKILDMIGETEKAEEFLHCLILSYERLKAYCEVIGEKKVLSECVERIFELKEKLKTEKFGKKSDPKVQNGIRSLLGLTIPKAGIFDVFISHKSEDTDIASEMYDYLKVNMKEAFYDKETLPQMSEAQYRKAIMSALDGSKHFVVILSDLSFLESYWVSLEMEIFMSEIDEGRKPGSNFLFVVTNKVYDEIMSTNKAALPIEYRRCEIMKVSEYKTKLLSYLNKTTFNN